MSTFPFISFTFWSPFNFTIQPTISLHISPLNSSMKDLSLFLVKNSLAAKMKRGIRSFCNGVGSTSTLDQKKNDCDISCIANDSYVDDNPLTLEEMILQLDLEAEAARRAKIDDYSELNRRMSCVNNSDILRSARNAAMNQYPRFSLDGRDAMYRSSFRNYGSAKPGRRSVCCSSSTGGRFLNTGCEVNFDGNIAYPPTIAGESVVWCKPGVVAKLMGLDAVPVPVRPGRSRLKAGGAFSSRKENLRRVGRYELEKERLLMNINGCKGGSNYNAGRYCMMKPINIEPMNGPLDWNFRRASR